jgi:hypothetical protein
MIARPAGKPASQPWPIVGVDFPDNLKAHKAYVALLLADAPSVVELRTLVPEGSVLTVLEPDSQVAA